MASSSLAEEEGSFCRTPFWDANLTWNTYDPELSPCFRYTALVWAPVAFLLLTLPLHLSWYHNRNSSKSSSVTSSLKWTVASATKSLIIVLLMLLGAVQLIYSLLPSNALPWAYTVASIVRIVAAALTLGLVYTDRKNGFVTSGALWIFWLVSLIAQVLIFRSAVRHYMTSNAGEGAWWFFWTEAIALVLIAALFFLSCFADVARDRPPVENENPELRSSFLNKLTFEWFTGMAITGYRRPLEQSDMWLPNPDDRTDVVVQRFGHHWDKEMSKFRESERQIKSGVQRKPYSPSIILASTKTFWQLEVSGALLKLANDLLLFVSPQILNGLIVFVSLPRGTGEPSWHGYFYACLLFVSAVTQTLLLHQYFHRTMRLGLQIRAAVMAVIYRKALRMSTDEKRQRTVGETVNLMSVDAQRLQDLMTYINMLWSAPLQIVLALFFLWQQLGVSALAGFAVMIILLPMNAVFAMISRRYQVAQMKRKDERIKTMTEILGGIKVLKLYAWESSFLDIVNKIRRAELITLRQLAYINAFASMFWILAPFLVALASFACYVLLGNQLTPQKAFVSLALFNILRFPLNMLPMIITSLVQAGVSIQRVKSYISAEELDDAAVERLPANKTNSPDSPPALEIIDAATFRWGRTDPQPTLSNVELRIPQGKLVAVVGTVGSGKSSLCSALLGLMLKERGTVRIRGRIAYVPQQAWIQNATVRDNICFANKYQPALYDCVVDACALRPDLEMLSAGDATEIGEKGINLSGGQKQRVSLARAVYSNADIFILDDPLSAVDAHVGKHIFEQIISNRSGLLKNKTRLLVTHGIGFLPYTDLIVVMKDGRVQEIGTYKELLQSNGEFAEFLRQEAKDDDQSSSSDEKSVAASKAAELSADATRKCAEIYAAAALTAANDDDNDDTVENGGGDFVVKRNSNSSGTKNKPFIAAEAQKLLSNETTRKQKAVLQKIPSQIGKLISKETTEIGSVKWSTYLLYFKYSTILCTLLTVTFYMLFNACSVGANIWLAAWSTDAAAAAAGDNDNNSASYRLGIYAALGAGQGVFVMLSSIVIAYGSILASKNLHRAMLQNILRAPMAFFDTTPLGRIINRFSKDVDVVDSMIPMNWRMWLNTMFQVVATIAVIIYSTWIFVFVVPPLIVLYWLVQRFYIATSRQLKRLESVTRSPIYSHFQESISGTPVIIATGQQQRFILENETRIDVNNISYYPNIASQRWLAVRLEFVGNIMVFCAALFAVISRDYFEIDAGKVGLSISYALSVTQTLNWMVRMTSELETNVVAVERIKEYAEVPTEAALINNDYRPPSNGSDGSSRGWPSAGDITFNDYATRYRPGLDLVIKGISCHIVGGEKIGIVGRTGAGKSSLTLGLFRIVEPANGTITIDGLDISRLGLYDLRSRLTVIPQDPVLFSGTLRMNLDPFSTYTDEQVWAALEQAHLKQYVSSLADGLQYKIAEEGSNLSVGQRQLVCLARALLRKTQVLVLDEATAAVDMETDNLIQNTIRQEFRPCTVLTIAHRINTILDSTRVMVLHAGRISEFDTPANLLQNPDSLFYSLCRDANLFGRAGGGGGGDLAVNNPTDGGSGDRQNKRLFVSPEIRALLAHAGDTLRGGGKKYSPVMTPVGPATSTASSPAPDVHQSDGSRRLKENLDAADVHREEQVVLADQAPTMTVLTSAAHDDSADVINLVRRNYNNKRDAGNNNNNDDGLELQLINSPSKSSSVPTTNKVSNFEKVYQNGDGNGDDEGAAVPLLPNGQDNAVQVVDNKR